MRRQFKSNWPLYAVWVTIFISTVAITCFYGSESSSFYGIAETREIVANFESAVEIKRIGVTEGQSVEAGVLMVELNSPELMLKINHISHQLDQLRAQKGVDKSEVLSRLRQLKAEKAARENEIENQISQLENQYRINQSLLSGLKSIPSGLGEESHATNSPMALKIKNLKKELSLSVHPLMIQIELLQKTLASLEDPVKIQVERLEEELSLLQEENSKLNIYAQISGIIGSVNFKPGEKVSPFSPILTLHTKTPSLIKGYIYENAYSGIAMGESVTVSSLALSDHSISGCVVGIGGRIVEYPVRLRKHPDMQVWGREVVIKIPGNNPFILGEKVLITSSVEGTGFADKMKRLFFPSESMADVNPTGQAMVETSTVRSVVPLETGEIEASAMLYLEDIDRYMLLSDDTPGNAPLVFLMNSDGIVTKETTISGLDAIKDMESVAQGEPGILYIASSLNTGNHGKINPLGNRLVAVQRQGERFSLLGMVDLYSLLKARAEQERGADWAEFVLGGMAERSLDLEGMFYKEGALFLGFKAPSLNAHSVIIKISDIDSAMGGQGLKAHQTSIWQRVNLTCADTPTTERISDLLYVEGILYITGTPLVKKGGSRSGSLWALDAQTGIAKRLVSFKALQPEGIAAGKEKQTLMLCFDQGRNEDSKLSVVKVNQ
ncbi:hypothetical protein DSLASN_08870 [Desulfoluna limicola]|uniref:Uncharacterized protein n=1 Tax=Desulfoluna limicola TaxID=2810562 RepID=A0ABM7PDK2_9BACT|nr:hypothetical protein DSLASN_08870 [Desulfoluna limicola]